MDDVCAGFYVVLSLICFMILSGYYLMNSLLRILTKKLKISLSLVREDFWLVLLHPLEVHQKYSI